MSIFTIQTPDGRKLKIEAADEATAIRGAQEWSAANPAKPQMDAAGFAQHLATGEQSQNIERAAPPAPPRPDLMTSTAATVNGLVASVPFLQEASDAIIGVGGMPFGKDYGETVRGLQQKRQEIAQTAPIARGAGQIGGTIAGMGVLGSTKAGAEMLGLTGKFLPRVVNSGLSSAGYSGLQSIASGKEGGEVLTDMGIDGLIGAGSPFVTKGLEMGGKAIGDNIVRPVATMLNRDNEAIKRTSRAIMQDRATGGVMSSADEATARQAGVPVTNADRFGQATRTLARTATNVSPEADAALKRTVEDRFASQAPRAQSFVNRLMNGATDDLALQDGLRTAASASNNIAYGKARANPAARAVWNQPIKELMQSDTFRAAINAAESRGTDRAAISGFKAVKNPFTFGADGSIGLRKMPDGSTALPSLDFWDQVKRNLDRQIGIGKRAGDDISDLMGLKTKLVSALDQAVPEYRAARQGAAAFFGADDAIDAGRKAFNSPRQIPEIERAVAKMTKAEQDAFSVGFASELMDRIKTSGDRQNVIQQVFGTPSMRERVAIALGPQKARELEAYVRVEGIVDQLRGAVTGNSTTAKQLIAAGILGGGAGFWTSGGNVQTSLTWAAVASLGRRGMQAMGQRVDDQVMKKVAEMLVSQDPKVLQRAVHNATLSKQHMEALEAIMRGLETTGRAAALAMTGS
jgi:hypothetical protein